MRGGPSSLVASFQQLYGDVLRILTWSTGNPERAADLAQDTFLRISAVQETGTEVANHRAFILRVASNLAVDHLRRDRRLAALHGGEGEAERVADAAPRPDRILAARERLRLLDEALMALPPKPRQALLLHRVHGLSQAEVAARLGVSESMVIKYVAQALRHCRDWQRRVEADE